MKPTYCAPYKMVLVALFLLIAGCSTGRQAGIWVTEEEFRNYDASKEMVETALLYWPFQSGMIRAGMGSDMDKIPRDIVAAMDKLDKIAALPTADRDDRMLGEAFALQAKVKSEIAKTIFDRYFPGLYNALRLLK